MKRIRKIAICSILLILGLTPGCDDLSEPADISDPQDLIKIWTITEVQIDKYNRDFSGGELTFTGTTFYGHIDKLEGIGSGIFSGEYTVDKKTLYLDVLSTTNEEMIMAGMKVADYKADPSRAQFSYTSFYNTRIKIKLEY